MRENLRERVPELAETLPEILRAQLKRRRLVPDLTSQRFQNRTLSDDESEFLAGEERKSSES